MTTEQIEKAINFGVRYKMGWKVLASKLMGPPFDLTAADATKVLDEYKRRLPKASEPIEVPQAAHLAQSGVPAESNYTQSILNRSAVKSFALKISQVRKAGKFKRVSAEFVQSVEASVEAFIRDLSNRSDDDIPADCDFLNRKAIRPKVEEKLNDAIRKIIIRKVCANNIGKTLK
jgi:hypothetical protein